MTRREFFVGGAAFGALGAFGGNRFVASAIAFSVRPRLRFGVVSDVHIMSADAPDTNGHSGSPETFRKTLEWFRGQEVDAVVIAGDIADKGMVEQLKAMADAWYSVFPDDKKPDGSRVEKVFVTGNHDWIGYRYGKYAEKLYPDKAERGRHILSAAMPKWWGELFHERYEPIYSKNVNGYTFIGSHWDTDGLSKGGYPFARIEGFMKQHGGKIDPKMPFFYVQHPHPKDTVYGPWAWGHDRGVSTKTLSAYSNAIAFSGHSHYSLTDERSIWQGAFTSVGTASLRYSAYASDELQPGGCENSRIISNDKVWRYEAEKLMPCLSTGDCRQGMLWSVYDDCITVKRREFVSGLDLGPDWVMPLPSAEPRPFAFAEHAKKCRAPSFAPDAKLEVSVVKAKNRGGKSKDGKEKVPSVERDAYKVVAPAVVADKAARVFRLEFVAESEGVKKTKLVAPEGFNHALGHPKSASRQFCLFSKSDFGGKSVRFSVAPVNCFGKRGKAISVQVG